jgi:hypothetical protein
MFVRFVCDLRIYIRRRKSKSSKGNQSRLQTRSPTLIWLIWLTQFFIFASNLCYLHEQRCVRYLNLIICITTKLTCIRVFTDMHIRIGSLSCMHSRTMSNSLYPEGLKQCNYKIFEYFGASCFRIRPNTRNEQYFTRAWIQTQNLFCLVDWTVKWID